MNMKIQKSSGRSGNSLFRQPWISMVFAIALVVIILSILQPSFFSVNSLKNVFLQSSFTAIIAVGMTFVILSGGIDISVGMNVFLCMATMSELAKVLPIWSVFIIGILVGTIVGIINGFLICVFEIVPMIATLSTLSICRGIAYILIDSKMKVAAEGLRIFGLSNVLGIPVPVIVMLVIALAGYFLLRNTRLGRYVLAVGNSVTSARETGIKINLVRFVTYAMCGFCASIASIIYIGRLGTVQTDTAYGIEFTVITAVVLGGTKLSGGRGTIPGSILGCIFLILIESFLSFMEVSGFFYDVVRGGILFIAIVFEFITTMRQNRLILQENEMRLRQS